MCKNGRTPRVSGQFGTIAASNRVYRAFGATRALSVLRLRYVEKWHSRDPSSGTATILSITNYKSSDSEKFPSLEFELECVALTNSVPATIIPKKKFRRTRHKGLGRCQPAIPPDSPSSLLQYLIAK